MLSKVVYKSFVENQPVIIDNLPKEDAVKVAQALSASPVCMEVIVTENYDEKILFEYKYQPPF